MRHGNQSIVPADILTTDFKTKNNTLSVWEIEDDQSNLCRVIIALSCNMNIVKIKEFEYVMIESQLLQRSGYKIRKRDGTTRDKEVNKRWHYDIEELSGEMLLQIAKLFYENSKPITMFTNEVENCLKECIEFISIKEVSKPELKDYLNEFKTSLGQ